MRYKGRITEWQDDRGYGFITPMIGDNRVFVHIKSFTSRHRRPNGDELVTYELSRDTQGRLQGVNVSFSGDLEPPSASTPGPGAKSILFTVIFLVFVSAAVTTGKLPSFVVWLYLVSSGITFIAYVWDKSSAMNNQWRTQESTLQLCSLIGGWPGALVAQKYLRHKTSKRSFQMTFWGTVVLNCVGLIWLLMNPGIL